MNKRALLVVATLWIVSVVGVAVWAQSKTPPAPGQRMGEVITGENIGFQRFAQGYSKDGKVIGKWMVKIDGKWMETQAPIEVIRSR